MVSARAAGSAIPAHPKRRSGKHQQAHSPLYARRDGLDGRLATQPHPACSPSQRPAKKVPRLQDTGRSVHGTFARRTLNPYPKNRHDALRLDSPRKNCMPRGHPEDSRSAPECRPGRRRPRHQPKPDAPTNDWTICCRWSLRCRTAAIYNGANVARDEPDRPTVCLRSRTAARAMDIKSAVASPGDGRIS